jgi:hypothetical protein
VIPGVIGAGLIAVGLGALVAPRASATVFGLPTDDATALAFARVAGVRDVVLGALILGTLGKRRALRRVLAWTSLIGLADAVTLFAMRGPRPEHVAHLGGFAALLLAAGSIRD